METTKLVNLTIQELAHLELLLEQQESSLLNHLATCREVGLSTEYSEHALAVYRQILAKVRQSFDQIAREV